MTLNYRSSGKVPNKHPRLNPASAVKAKPVKKSAPLKKKKIAPKTYPRITPAQLKEEQMTGNTP